ncbi:MAG TPA: acetyl-CoA carboxylase biotin carboxyl carrier protein [Saprospiraceae bacterium]|nr:acetyl-CoA carboxylase biotin carboxyl carrier protein [Saprospiraceae bacterium]
MDSKEIQELLKLINRLELAEFKYKQGDLQFSVRTKYYLTSRSGTDGTPSYVHLPAPPQVTSAPSASHPAPPARTSAETEADASVSAPTVAAKDNLIEIRSPIVGTFYRSASPDKPVYVKPGDVIEVGAVVCIVEAMKLFNEIESEVAGRVVKIMVEDASPVEYDQLLFLIDPNG